MNYMLTEEHNRNNFEVGKLQKEIVQFCKCHNILLVNKILPVDKDKKDLLSIIKDNPNQKILYFHVHDALVGLNWAIIDNMLKDYNCLLVVATDSIVEIDNVSNIRFFQHPVLFGINFFHANINNFTTINNNNPTKLFNCFINRTEATRQSWFYFLYLANLLDRGYVSCLMNQIYDLSGLKLFDYNHYNGLNTLEKFNQAYDHLRSMVPYRNFNENGILIDKILDSKYSIVLDSFAVGYDNIGSWFVSEKVIRSLTTPTIDLLFVQSGCIKRLKNIGLEINDYAFDNDDWRVRQQKILDIVSNDLIEYNYSHEKDIA